MWRDGPNGAFFASGHGGQFVCVVPDRDLVVVVTAEPASNAETAGIFFDELLPLTNGIVDAIRE